MISIHYTDAKALNRAIDLITPLLETGGDLISRKELLEEIAATRPHQQASWSIFVEIVKDLIGTKHD